MPRLARALALIAASCGAPERPPVTAPATVSTPAIAPPSIAMGPSEPTPAPARPPPPLPPPEILTPVALPFAPDAILVEPVLDGPMVALFPDEARAIRRRVATWLVDRGHPIIPIDEVERIEDAALAGRLALEGDRKCRVPLPPAELGPRYFATQPRATIDAQCDFEAECAMHLTIIDKTGTVAMFSSKRVRRPEDPKAWIATVPSLGEGLLGIIGVGMSGMSHPPPMRFESPVGIGGWKRPPDETLFGEAEASTTPCAHPDPLIGMRWSIRVAVDRGGHVTRCTAETPHLEGRAQDGACLCRVVETLRHPAGAAGRRLRIEAIDDGGFDGSNVKFAVVQPGTEPWIERMQSSATLRRCLASRPLARPLVAEVAVKLTADGTVEDVRVDGDLVTLDRMRFAACVVDGIEAVAFPCAPPGITRLRTRMRVGTP